MGQLLIFNLIIQQRLSVDDPPLANGTLSRGLERLAILIIAVIILSGLCKLPGSGSIIYALGHDAAFTPRGEVYAQGLYTQRRRPSPAVG